MAIVQKFFVESINTIRVFLRDDVTLRVAATSTIKRLDGESDTNFANRAITALNGLSSRETEVDTLNNLLSQAFPNGRITDSGSG